MKAGFILLLGSSVESTHEKQSIAHVRVYPGADGDFTFYSDDGETYAYEAGDFQTTHLHWDDAAKKLVQIGAKAWNEDGMIGSNRYRGVNLFAGRRVVVPDDLLVRGDDADSELMREQNVTVRQHDGTAYLTFPRGVVVSPHDLTVANDKDAAVVRFAGVHEVVLSKPLAGKVRRNGRRGFGGA